MADVFLLHASLLGNLIILFYEDNVKLSRSKILETLNDEVDLFSERLVGSGSRALVGGVPLIYVQQNISSLAKVLGYPKLLLKVLHGCYHGTSRDFDHVDMKYGKLLETAAADELKTDLGIIQKHEAEKFIVQLNDSKQKLFENTEKWGCGMMDHYRLPHPLLGKITVRETLYVTILEVQYRRKLLG